MTRVLSLILLLWALGPVQGSQRADAQGIGEAPPTRRAGSVANLFSTLDPSSPIDGVRLQFPADWEIQDVHLLRYGTKSIPVDYRTERDDSILLTTPSPIQGPHELVVRAQLGTPPGRYQWHMTPFVVEDGGDRTDAEEQQVRATHQRTREVKIEAPVRPSGSNYALDLERADTPLLLRLPRPLSLSREASFAVEFWMQTNGLDQVVLSSWTGREDTPYPLEFVVDQSGRLRYYSGQPGRHQALRSKVPVADGHWHHVAIVFDQADTYLQLMLDGTVVDSVRARALASPSDPVPLAIGGRRPDPTKDPSGHRLYRGRLDEIRIWPTGRSPATLRRMKDRPFVDEDPEDQPLRLSFDQDPDLEHLEWATGARRVPSHLTFRSPLRGLKADTDGQSVTLRWKANTGTGTFIIERSSDGTSFSTVDRLSPLYAAPEAGAPEEMTYTDENAPGQVVYYRVRQVTPNAETERSTGTIKIGLGADTSTTRAVELVGNFPNPFKTSTTIAYRVQEPQPITLTVWNLSGKRIASLTEGMHEPGYYEHTLNADDLPSGTYFVRLETAQGVQSHRMVLLK